MWFFSLDAHSQLAVLGGRWLFELPYVYAEMKVRKEEGRIDYSLRRRTGERLVVNYAPTGPVQRAAVGSLEHFLTERYRLYAQSSAGRLYCADIHHVPWPLQPAQVELRQNDLLLANGLAVDGAPIAHYVEQLHVAIWPLKAVVR